MTDKEYNEQKLRIRKLAKKWIKPIGLGWWNIDIEYYREKENVGDKNDETIMSVTPDWKYLTATIHCFLPSVATLDDERLEWAFVHELMHIMVSPMSSKEKEEQEEFVATTLAKSFVWAVSNIKKEELCKSGKKKKSQIQKHSKEKE